MQRQRVPGIHPSNDSSYSLESEAPTSAIAHDLDDDEDEVEFDADDRHCGVRHVEGTSTRRR